jgi:Mrp family chromosome partitioning ATPase
MTDNRDNERGRDNAPSDARGLALILGRLPAVEGLGDKPNLVLHMRRDPRSAYARALADLVENLAVGAGSPGHVMVLSSIRSGDGATTTAACLAEAWGKAGLRVLLIDASPSQRGLSTLMKASAAPGLFEVIGGAISASKAAVRRANFVLIPFGSRRIGTDSQTIAALEAFLSETRSRFDLVLIDAPRCGAGGEAITFAALADRLVLVASRDHLLRDPFVKAIDAAADSPRFAGLVLNRTTLADAERLAAAS